MLGRFRVPHRIFWVTYVCANVVIFVIFTLPMLGFKIEEEIRLEKERPRLFITPSVGLLQRNVEIIVGVPTVRRPNDTNYLEQTLSSLLRRRVDFESVAFVVCIADEEHEDRRNTVETIQSAFAEEVESGVIQMIVPPEDYYPNWDNDLKMGLGDYRQRVKWRSKHNLDEAFLMDYVYKMHPKYYLMLEDDVEAEDDYLSTIFKHAQSDWREDLILISYCQYGAIGKLLRVETLPTLSQFLKTMWTYKPIDWLISDFLRTIACIYPDTHCDERIDAVKIDYPRDLFKHKGRSKYGTQLLARIGQQVTSRMFSYYKSLRKKPAFAKLRIYVVILAVVAAVYILHPKGEVSENICEICRRHPKIPVANLSRCTVCYQELKNESAEAKMRNAWLLRYDDKAKKVVEHEQRLPDVIGIGVRKCGSTWLQYAMSHHPMIKTTYGWEPHFFGRPKNYNKGENFYKSMLPNVTKYELSMEKTGSYFNNPRRGDSLPPVVHNLLPNAKLWLVLCNPAGRAVSDFAHVTISKELPLPSTFDEYVNQYLPAARIMLNSSSYTIEQTRRWAMEDRPSAILSFGIYHPMLKEWLKFFKRSQIHIMSGEDLMKSPGPIIEKLQDYLGIPRLLLTEDFVKNPETGLYCISPTVAIESKLYKVPKKCIDFGNKGRTRSSKATLTVSDNLIQKLEEFYQPFNEELFRMLGRRLW